MRFVNKIPITILIATAFGLLVHVVGLSVVLSGNTTEFLVYGDANHYLELAKNINEGNGFVYQVGGSTYKELFRAPGLPFVLSLFLENGSISATYFFLLTILSALIIPLSLYGFVNNIFNSQIAAVATWLYVIDPLTTIFTWHPQTEGLLMLFLVPGLFILSHAVISKSVTTSIISGILLGVSIYIRPVIYPLVLVAFAILVVFWLLQRRKQWMYVFISGLVVFILITPWMQHVRQESGKFAVTASGWWNVYSDYVSSIRAVKNGTGMVEEKVLLEEFAESGLKIAPGSFQSPESSSILKDYALAEIRQNLPTVLKLQSLLAFNFFTNTSYQAYLGRLGLIERIPRLVSPSHVLLSEGYSGIPKVYAEMKRVYFMPVIERVWGIGILLFAFLGIIARRKEKIIWLFTTIILLGMLTSSAIGLGVEARLRVPILPLYYVLVAIGLHTIYFYFKKLLRES